MLEQFLRHGKRFRSSSLNMVSRQGIRPPTEVTGSLLRVCLINTRRTNLNSLADDMSLVLGDDGDLKTCLVERFT